MKKLISLLVALGIGTGFYFGLFKIDPLSFVIVALILWNDLTATKRIEQLAAVLKKSHEVLATNDREIVKRIEMTRTDIRSKN